MKFKQSIAVALLVCTVVGASAQSTFTQVYQLLQTKCAGAGCHSAGVTAFDVTGPESAVYNALVNATPENSAAAAKGDKLVMPGYAERSFLLRKIAHGISDPLVIDTATEGKYEPNGLAKLPDNEIELVRQWIIFGAPQTGTVVDTAMINSYYRDGGIDETYPDRTPPAPGTGFQMYMGRIFMAPHTETYYYIKHDPRLTADTEIPRVVTMFPAGTHHFVIYKFFPGGDINYREGLRGENESSHADVSDGIGTGPNFWEYVLPEGCAYFWEQNTMLDFNLHIKNPYDSIMSADLYINLYTQPLGTAEHFMLIRNFPNFDLTVPQDSLEHTVTLVANDLNETHKWKVWQLYSHTHKYGTDYDIYMRNEDGSRGAQVYEGMYSYEQGFMVGYYRNGVDATFRFFPDDGLLEVDPRVGFIEEAKYRNTNGPNPVNWGITSAEEMMVMGFQYIQGDDITGVAEPATSTSALRIYPNPADNGFALAYQLDKPSDVNVELFNMLGEKVSTLVNEQQQSGAHTQTFSSANYGLMPGVYFVKVKSGENIASEKLIIQD